MLTNCLVTLIARPHESGDFDYDGTTVTPSGSAATTIFSGSVEAFMPTPRNRMRNSGGQGLTTYLDVSATVEQHLLPSKPEPGDEVTITSGPYDGTYTVDRVDDLGEVGAYRLHFREQ